VPTNPTETVNYKCASAQHPGGYIKSVPSNKATAIGAELEMCVGPKKITKGERNDSVWMGVLNRA
jgi:hypothetical protein